MEKDLIGNLLDEKEEAEAANLARYAKTKRSVLLNPQEVANSQSRSSTAPPEYQYSFFSDPVFWPDKSRKQSEQIQFDMGATEFVPSDVGAAMYAPVPVPYAMYVPTAQAVIPNANKNGTGTYDSTNSRHLQQRLEIADDYEKQQIWDEIAQHVLYLMKDQYGNFLIQKFMDFGLPQHQDAVITTVLENTVDLSFDSYGCRVVQKALDVTTIHNKHAILSQLMQQTEACLLDSNANHVIQKVVEVLSFDKVAYILEFLKGNLIRWATHIYGCRVIQKFIEFFPAEKTEELTDLVFNRFLDVCRNEYGNYVVQHIIEFSGPQYRQRIYSQMHGNILSLSCHKFSSNVIEKLIQYSEPSTITEIGENLVELGDDQLLGLMTDKYGNYVVQKMMEAVEGEIRDRIAVRILSFEKQLKACHSGRHILACLEKKR